MSKTEVCIESYSRHRNLKLVESEIGIPWQTVYWHLKRADIKVTGDKARYGSASDRIAIIGEQRFHQAVPIAINNNNQEYQSTIDFSVGAISIDIKTARIKRNHSGKNNKPASPRWGFCINKQLDIADFFVFYALDDNDLTHHIFLLPKEVVTTKTTISIPESMDSKWADYKIEESELLPFFKSMLTIN
ncbi:hypothetical protein [Pragia fontium]|uniref:hypothetical protein n=1 Tax=Pragia fontium TaxID=82985 RepID=UPI00064A105E|nr:hypothetical protein [Pragia fontium]AKJ41769.1 hypothetical protein QQ39_06455 [Pragia fontium]